MPTLTSPVTGVDFVSVPTTDLDAATEFYGTVLGLPRSSVYQRGAGAPVGAEFEAGDLTLSVILSETLGIDFRPINVPIALHVEDIEAARAELESRGISFCADTLDTCSCSRAVSAYPACNALMLHHRYAPKERDA